MKKLILTLSTVLVLSGCSNIVGGLAKKALSGGGGPSLSANVQAGKENTQQVVANQERRTVVAGDASTVTVTESNEKVSAGTVKSIVVNERTPPWIWLLALVGWLAPSPNEIGRWIRGVFKRG